MAWAYVCAMIAWAFIPGVKRAGKLFVPAILMLGILPDADLFLGTIGVAHRTITHSFFFWIIVFLPFFIIFRLKSVPYFVAVVQHFAFGDLLIGTRVTIFWPFSSSFVGFNFGMASPIDVALETAGLVLTLGIMVYIGDLKRLFSVDKSNVLMLLPSLALLASASAVFFAFHRSSTNSFASYLSSGDLLIVLAIGHLILFAFLAVSALQGLRGFRTKESRFKARAHWLLMKDGSFTTKGIS